MSRTVLISTTRSALILAAVLFLDFSALSANAQTAQILYDTLWIHDSGVMDAGVGNAIGGFNGPLRETTDAQIAEDVDIAEPTRLTRAFYDIFAYNSSVPAEGVWMQIFADAGGKPSAVMAAEDRVPPTRMKAEEISSPLQFKAYRLELDLSASAIELLPGRWWFVFQPLDEFTTGDWFYTIASISIPRIGDPSHVRDSGPAHGNGYRGIWNTTEWVPHSFRGNAVLSFKLEGEPANRCTNKEKLNLTCKNKSCGLTVTAKLKNGMPSAELSFILDGVDTKVKAVGANGKAKVKWCGVSAGPHTVEAAPCTGVQTVNCP